MDDVIRTTMRPRVRAGDRRPKNPKRSTKVKGRTTETRLMMRAATLSIVCLVSIISTILLADEAKAQAPWNVNSGNPNTNMWLPNTEGYTTPPYVPAQEGQAPPIGDGNAPLGINPGHLGYGIPEPASHVPGIPPVPAGQQGKDMVNGYVAPYLTPPPSTGGMDPGLVTNPQDFYAPPAAWVNINASGGMPGDQAPTQRWGGQTTRDLGRNPGFSRGFGSTCNDFGEKLREKPDLKMMPQSSEDGPRQGATGGGGGRASSLPGAQATEDLHGNRSFFKGENLRSRLTIAPY
jgi:hypothetical protein